MGIYKFLQERVIGRFSLRVKLLTATTLVYFFSWAWAQSTPPSAPVELHWTPDDVVLANDEPFGSHID